MMDEMVSVVQEDYLYFRSDYQTMLYSQSSLIMLSRLRTVLVVCVPKQCSTVDGNPVMLGLNYSHSTYTIQCKKLSILVCIPLFLVVFLSLEEKLCTSFGL